MTGREQSWHYLVAPGVAACGADVPNQCATDALHYVNCIDCLRNYILSLQHSLLAQTAPDHTVTSP